MVTEIKNKEFKRLEEIASGLENKTITVDSISDNDVPLISALLQYEIYKVQDKISQVDEVISDYKKRMLNAIEYLKTKNK